MVVGGAATAAPWRRRRRAPGADSGARARRRPDASRRCASIAALPVEVVGEFREPLGYQRARLGRRSSSSTAAATPSTASTRPARPAASSSPSAARPGRVIEPTAFDAAPDGTLRRRRRAQRPRARAVLLARRPAAGRLLRCPGRATPRVDARQPVAQRHRHAAVHRPLGAHQPAGNRRADDRYGLAGTPVRTIGRLRADRARGRPRAASGAERRHPAGRPGGGFWFVFLAGTPAFSRFDANGALLFHRAMQGREIDPIVAAIPAAWPRRAVDGTEIPLVSPVDPHRGGRRRRPALGLVRRALHLRLRRAGREGPHGAVPGRRPGRAEQPALFVAGPAAGHARVLRVRGRADLRSVDVADLHAAARVSIDAPVAIARESCHWRSGAASVADWRVALAVGAGGRWPARDDTPTAPDATRRSRR